VEHAQGTGGLFFRRWSNVRRDLIEACVRAGIPPCSPNELRRTCATWLRAAGAPPDLIAPVMGHADTRMVERVYGRLSPSDLRGRLASALGLPDCSAFATNSVETPVLVNLLYSLDRVTPRKQCPGAESNHRHEDFQRFSRRNGNELRWRAPSQRCYICSVYT
jgi:hypothetical protein